MPQNHPDVVADLGDLAKCISIMPTSGSLFTAQAPLLPVLLLGLLATEEDHLKAALVWFEQVCQTPISSVSPLIPRIMPVANRTVRRQSVPSLYEALKQTRSLMSDKMPLSWPDTPLPPIIADREAWFEKMIKFVADVYKVLSVCSAARL